MQTYIKFLNFHVSLLKNFLKIFNLSLDKFLRHHGTIAVYTDKIHTRAHVLKTYISLLIMQLNRLYQLSHRIVYLNLIYFDITIDMNLYMVIRRIRH